MKISLEWLKEYVQIRERPGKLKDDLTMLGLAVESVSEIEGDTILELEITSNRPDCLCLLGVAREVAALYKRPVRIPAGTKKLALTQDEIVYKIQIKNASLCPRYTGLVMDGITIGPSPPWMQRRLEASGMRPLNNLVDITNYVLLEMGHPLHAFDFRRLRGGKIVVARAKRGQKLKTLDGVERELDEQMLLINDGEGPVAIAGVMGGYDSEITSDTSTVLLECAYFQPASIRRTSKTLGLSTEASYRFERGANWADTTDAIARACRLIEELAGGKIAGSLQDVYPLKLRPAKIQLRRQRAEALLGVSLTNAFIVSTLKRLEFTPVPRGRDAWQVTCPTYRADMELEADLIEEVARIYGYQKIPSTLPALKTAGTPSPVYPYESAARRVLLGLGYQETINLSFAAEKEHRQFPGGGEPVFINNPLTEETQYLRSTLACGLVKATRRNFNQGLSNVRIFEIGKIYRPGKEGQPEERNTLGILGAGCYTGKNWHHPEGNYDFFHLKGVVSALVRGLRTRYLDFVPESEVAWLNSAKASALLLTGKRIGVLGALHPDLQEEYKFKDPIYIAEIDFEALSEQAFSPVAYVPLPKFPAAERDLSVVIGRDISYGAILTAIAALGIKELVSIDLIDVYEGGQIPQNKLSLTLRFVFQDRQKTLTIDQVQFFSDNILKILRDTYGAERR